MAEAACRAPSAPLLLLLLPACRPGCILTAAEPEAMRWEAARGDSVVSIKLGGRLERQVATARMEGSSDL